VQPPLLHQHLATQPPPVTFSSIVTFLLRSSLLITLFTLFTNHSIKVPFPSPMNTIQTKCVVKRKTRETDETFSFEQSKDTMKKNGFDRHRPKRYPLMSFWELPEYMKDNEYILRYYRANWPFKQALFSLFRWHNETLNVWT